MPSGSRRRADGDGGCTPVDHDGGDSDGQDRRLRSGGGGGSVLQNRRWLHGSDVRNPRRVGFRVK
jgi:hypothetical protein